MTLKEFFAKITAPVIWGNLLAMGLVLMGIAFGVWIGLDKYTHHGEIIEVPNVKEQTITDARYLLNESGLDAVVADSSYNRNLPPGAVLEQTPAPGAKVKSGHAIYLIINATSTPTIPIPDIADNSSVREAEARLVSLGFKITQPEYIDGEKDWVYGVKCNGRMVYAGDRLPIDARITLQVGSGSYSYDNDSIVEYIDSTSVNVSAPDNEQQTQPTQQPVQETEEETDNSSSFIDL